MPGHSTTLVVLGTFILWIGWIGFNVGSLLSLTKPGATVTAARVAVRTTLAGSSATLTVRRERARRVPL